ncbi:MAG TPA: tetratricopeptide repeat protein [Candidatus Aquilonibacter sp.]|nr:tetratricopeptide repeat protein [Candidatus Aquilonibacter sp.]
MAHISRKELKTDEVRETFAHGAQAILSHQQLTTYLLAAVLVVALGIFGWRWYSQRQDAQSSTAFSAAMDVFQAPVATAGQPPAAPGALSFSDDKTKYTQAAAKFAAVASEFPHADNGTLAKYFEAVSDEHIDKNDEAKRLLSEVAGNSNANYAAMARYELAQVDDRTGQGDAAAKLYQELIDKPAILVPKPVAMLALAEHYEKSDPTQAAKLLGQIKADYPDTPIADQADQDLSMLPAGNS